MWDVINRPPPGIRVFILVRQASNPSFDISPLCYTQVLSSDQVLDCDESVVFDAAVRWLQADSPSRRKHTPEVTTILYASNSILSSPCPCIFYIFLLYISTNPALFIKKKSERS